MNGLKTSGWKYWDYFQAINPGASVKGRHTFSALCAVPNDDLGMSSDDDGYWGCHHCFSHYHHYRYLSHYCYLSP